MKRKISNFFHYVRTTLIVVPIFVLGILKDRFIHGGEISRERRIRREREERDKRRNQRREE